MHDRGIERDWVRRLVPAPAGLAPDEDDARRMNHPPLVEVEARPRWNGEEPAWGAAEHAAERRPGEAGHGLTRSMTTPGITEMASASAFGVILLAAR